MPLTQWLKHAFSVDDGPLVPTPEQAELVDRLAAEVVRRGLTTPALAFLEMSQPLNYVASQALVFFSPMISAVVDAPSHRLLAEFLEHRGSVEYVCQRIEALSARQV
jgi:hypothetical protein